jgi:hypothetical protein
MDDTTHGNNPMEEEIMDKKELLVAIEKSVIKAMASNKELDESSARVSVLEGYVVDLATDNDSLLAQISTLKQETIDIKSLFDIEKTTIATEKDELAHKIEALESEKSIVESKLAEAAEILNKIEQEKLGEARIAELEAAGIKFSAERREKIVAKVSAQSEEDFASYKEDLVDARASVVVEEPAVDGDDGEDDVETPDSDEAAVGEPNLELPEGSNVPISSSAAALGEIFNEETLKKAFANCTTRTKETPGGGIIQ